MKHLIIKNAEHLASLSKIPVNHSHESLWNRDIYVGEYYPFYPPVLHKHFTRTYDDNTKLFIVFRHSIIWQRMAVVFTKKEQNARTAQFIELPTLVSALAVLFRKRRPQSTRRRPFSFVCGMVMH